MKKRNAILLSGFARNYQDTLSDFRKNLRNSEDVDLFACFWDFEGSRKKGHHKTIKKNDGSAQVICLDKDNGYLNVEKLTSDYSPTKIKIFNLDDITDIVEPMAKMVEQTEAVPKGLRSYYQVTRVSLMFFIIKQTFLLMETHEKENNFKYNNVVRARTDFVQGGYYPKVDWKKDYDDLYVGAWNWSGVGKFKLNDHFAISNRSNMELYCKFFDHMHVASKAFASNKYSSTVSKTKSKAWSPEHMLSIYFFENGVKWKPI
jgi:hypothetical protein